MQLCKLHILEKEALKSSTFMSCNFELSNRQVCLSPHMPCNAKPNITPSTGRYARLRLVPSKSEANSPAPHDRPYLFVPLEAKPGIWERKVAQVGVLTSHKRNNEGN